MKNILVTGAAGYIGSHTCLELLNNNYNIITIDNLSNSSITSLERIKKISNKPIKMYLGDLTDKNTIDQIFKHEDRIDGVIHFAALKSVGESTHNPTSYYQNNLVSTLNLIEGMQEYKINNIVFSSSATVYKPGTPPIREDFPIGASNPYGHTKQMTEQILTDWAKANNKNVTLLRYFNPVGAHPSGMIGEDASHPTNLLPIVQQVAAGKRPNVQILGNDYDTPDGTGIRDYIHVMDLANAHVESIKNMNGIKTYNVGTGTGYSVLEIINAFSKISGKEIPYEIAPRREGDLANVVADASLIKKELNWSATRNLNDMITDAWNWQTQNPNGYKV